MSAKALPEEHRTSIRQWLSRLLHRQLDEGSVGAAVRAPRRELDQLNLRNAIEAHQEWKHRLERAIRSRSVQALDARLVARDDQCALGKWIYATGGTQFGGDPQFLDLKAKHASFHRCAAQSLLLAQSAEQEEALAQLSSSSEFANLSWEVIGDLASIVTRDEQRASGAAPHRAAI